MGRKRNIKGHKNIFCPACCLILTLILAGCQYQYYPKLSIKTVEGKAGMEYLQTAATLAAGNYFQNALENNKKAYDLFPPELKNDAIFQKALIYAHPDNPDKNYEAAIVCLELIDKAPENAFITYNSRLILSILMERHDLEKKTRFNTRKMIRYERRIQKDQERIEALVKEQKKLKQQIKQLKEIDLNSSN
ncbi:MAG: hypothetical protein ABIJ59_15605 [Pseudomonadota bacterium]